MKMEKTKVNLIRLVVEFSHKLVHQIKVHIFENSWYLMQWMNQKTIVVCLLTRHRYSFEYRHNSFFSNAGRNLVLCIEGEPLMLAIASAVYMQYLI